MEYTKQQLDEIKSKAIQVSKEVGMASSDVINSIADTIQSGGYRMEEAIEIAKYYTDEFKRDTEKLNIKWPERVVPATSLIDNYIKFIEELENKGE